METTRQVSNNFNLDHLSKFASIYNTFVKHDRVAYNRVTLYNGLGRVILNKTTGKIGRSSELIDMNIFYDYLNPACPGFTKREMTILNTFYKKAYDGKYIKCESPVLFEKMDITEDFFIPVNKNGVPDAGYLANVQQRSLDLYIVDYPDIMPGY